MILIILKMLKTVELKCLQNKSKIIDINVNPKISKFISDIFFENC